ncbi:DUF3772 domain-containing protein [Oceaniglobus ichthyenteri]|uniref:DUF3772 domain-containing protein n=1 Tax=Oceaniglobus ichthyenteri TaxID=2136177 RepID=UPI000D3D8CB9|nr:DUF3772 domain-containing protein [Oceaniglobus ichthyenteri]
MILPLRAVLGALALWLLLACATLAQTTTDLAEWEGVAGRAEATLEADRASDRAMEQLRSELVQFREQFLAAQGGNQTRINTLLAQIAALGPAPTDSDPPEEPALAQRRAELAEQLTRLRAPQLSAEEAYNRADGLIREIDGKLRERQTEEVLRLGPSPLNPALWGPALSELGRSFDQLHAEIIDGLDVSGATAPWRESLPRILFYLVVAMILILRGRSWMERLTQRLHRGGHSPSNPAIGFIVSLSQVIVPVLGILAFREAAYLSGSLGLRGQIIAGALPQLGLLTFGAIWLGGRVFPRREDIQHPIPMPSERRAEGRYYTAVFGLLLCVAMMLDRLSEFDRYDDGTLAVLGFPLLLIGGLMLARLGQLLARTHFPLDGEGADSTVSNLGRLMHLTGRAAIGVGILGPVLGAVGFLTAGTMLVFPSILSLALLALLLVLRSTVRDFYALFTGRSEAESSEALTPVLIAFVLALVALPMFALIWGARLTDLWELWARFREGFSFGETRISPSDFLTFAVIFALGYGLTRLLQGTLRISVLPKTHIDTGGRNAIVAGVGYVGLFLAMVFAITAAGIDLSSLAIVAGALSVGIGFGLQNIVSNFVSGIILLIERPISEGDWVEVGGQMGYVRDISVRSTRIETFDRTDVIVPNGDFISGTVTNWTRGNLVGRVIVPVGVAYGSDTRQVEQILKEIAEAHPLVVLNPPPSVLFVGFGADSLDFEIRAILRDINFMMSVKSDMNHEIAAQFSAGGIEIPFAQRDVWLRNPEALKPAPNTPEGDPLAKKDM